MKRILRHRQADTVITSRVLDEDSPSDYAIDLMSKATELVKLYSERGECRDFRVVGRPHITSVSGIKYVVTSSFVDVFTYKRRKNVIKVLYVTGTQKELIYSTHSS